MIDYENYESNLDNYKKDFVLPEKVESISVSYYGGRLSISINGKEVICDNCAGNDFCVDINNKPLAKDNS